MRLAYRIVPEFPIRVHVDSGDLEKRRAESMSSSCLLEGTQGGGEQQCQSRMSRRPRVAAGGDREKNRSESLEPAQRPLQQEEKK